MLSLKNLTEQELIVAYCNGKEHAINELINRTQTKVYSGVYFLVKDKYLAEDLVQDAYIKALRKLREGAYVNDGKFTAWLTRIARNLCMDYFRVAQRHVKVTLKSGRDIFDVLEFEDTNHEDAIMELQTGNTLRKMLDHIPLDQREVLVMRLFGNMSFKEIAEETNSTLNTCLGRMRYGLRNMRKLMQEKQLVL
jgi:RNA polymerase sigma-70 factor (ECF subfamily)